MSRVSTVLCSVVLSLQAFGSAMGKDAKPAGKAAAKEDPACTIALAGTDTMRFILASDAEKQPQPESLKELKFPKTCIKGKDGKPGPGIKIDLKHTGKLPAAAMGHNIVIADASKQQELINAFLKAGPKTGADVGKSYVAEGAGDLGHTKTLGSGESESLSIAADKFDLAKAYSFFCSFPGHVGIMSGKVVFSD